MALKLFFTVMFAPLPPVPAPMPAPMAVPAPQAITVQQPKLILPEFPVAAPAANPFAADSALLARALGGPALELTTRGTSVTLLASATPVEGGCAAEMTARLPGGSPAYSRRVRWSDMAWSGQADGGRTKLAFFENEGRLANDMLAFAPGNAAAFQAALARVVSACRSAPSEGDRVLARRPGRAPSCYFARLPQLQLYDVATPAFPGDRPRAVLTLLSRENPEAELQLFLERGEAGEWGNPAVAFIYADRRLGEAGITGASFSLDGSDVVTRHSLTTFGDTRVRIAMDSFLGGTGEQGADSFYRRMVGSREIQLTLADGGTKPRAVLHFDVGTALAAARDALKSSDWTCAGAMPDASPAAAWKPVEQSVTTS